MQIICELMFIFSYSISICLLNVKKMIKVKVWQRSDAEDHFYCLRHLPLLMITWRRMCSDIEDHFIHGYWCVYKLTQLYAMRRGCSNGEIRYK